MNKFQETLKTLDNQTDNFLIRISSQNQEYAKAIDTLQELIDKYDELENKLIGYQMGYETLLTGSPCEILNFYIYDKKLKHVHKVGTDSHDSIYFRDNNIHYYNLQNGGGCTYGKDNENNWYRFTDEKHWCEQRIIELTKEKENDK